MSSTARCLWGLAAFVAAASISTTTASAQNHWPRQHAVQPVSELLPASLPAPSFGHPGAAGNEKPTKTRDHTTGGFTYTHAGFKAKVSANGRVVFSDVNVRANLFLVPPFIFIAGTLDITDVMMRWLGVDPYQYAKAQFLNNTFSERMRMRRRYDAQNMQQALTGLPAYLAAVWRQPWSAELRRRVLFVLWDECAEGGNKQMLEGGIQARRVIQRFVAINLPPGSRHGYRLAELRQLNSARTSQVAFAPYADMPQRTLVALRRARNPPKLLMNSALMSLATSF